MTHRLSEFGLAVPLVLIALAACGAPGGSAATPSPSASPAGSRDVALPGTSWTVTTIGGTAAIADAKPTMAFGVDGQVGGSAGCNQYSGPFRVEGANIQVGDLASTLMLCDGERGAQEMAFLAALRGAQTWHVTPDGSLELQGASPIVAEPAPAAGSASPAPSPGLVGASWDLVEMGQTADFAHFVPTIEFTPDGRVSGFAACNTFGGTYTTDGSTLTFGPLVTTKMACQRPASAIEIAYLEALAGVSSWSIEPDGRLLLGGAVPLRFAPH
jgi:heat shock protein HslJ